MFPAPPEEYGRLASIVAGHAHRLARPTPELGLGVFLVLGESRQHIREMFEAEPLAKLLALNGKPEVFHRHGLEHPLGAHVRGVIDFIPHTYDPDLVRTLAPRIPFEVVEEFVFAGNVGEVAQRLRGYAANGCEHVALLNLTGVVGGLPELTRHASGLAWLIAEVSRLQTNAVAAPRLDAVAVSSPSEVLAASH